MSERFSRLFNLPENLYAVGSPVVIAAGTLLKDNQTGKVVAQLKFRSISSKPIKAIKVRLDLLDTVKKPIGETVTYDYLDLSASRDFEFGQKTPVPIPDNKVRSYVVSIAEVAFDDLSVWTASGEQWEPLSDPAPLAFNDPELLKQYQLHFGSDSRYAPTEEKDLWHCTCGALNHSGENCHVCRNSLFELQTVDMAELGKAKAARLEQEAKRAAERKAAEDIQKQKNKKTLRIVIAAACAIIAVVVLMVTVVIPTMEANAEQNRLKAEYSEAVALMDAGKYEDAIAAFEAMNGYKDSSAKIKECETAILDGKYNEAVVLMDAGEYEAAIAAFESLGDFEDSTNQITVCQTAILDGKYNDALALANAGDILQALRSFRALGNYKDAEKQVAILRKRYQQTLQWATIAADGYHTLGLKADGSVVEVNHEEVSSWTDIIAIDTDFDHTVGLKADGTVVTAGSNNSGQCNVSGWMDIVAVSTGRDFTVGLKADGTVVATKYIGNFSFLYDGQCEVSDWKDIIAISAGYSHTVGLKADGTVVAVGNNSSGQCNVSGWKDIIAISAGTYHTVGLKADGTVVATTHTGKYERDGQCNVSGWTDIIAISAGAYHTVGLKADGTVVAVGWNENGQCNVSDWTDIVAISAGWRHTVGLKADGTVVAQEYTGDYYGGQCDLSSWTDIKLPN